MIKNRQLFIFLNSIIIISVIAVLILVAPTIPTFFRYFTVLSNLFMALVSLFAIFVVTKKKPTNLQTKLIKNLYLIATTSLVLVFLVVACFLAPQSNDYFYFFSDYEFFLHFLNPLFAVISLLLIKKPRYNPRNRLLTLIPPFLYAVFYCIFVIILKDWPDFYNFTFGGKLLVAPISLIIILATTYLISSILSFFCNQKTSRK